MPTIKLSLFYILIAIAIGCGPKQSSNNDVLNKVTLSQHPKIKKIIDSADHYELQVMLSTIDRQNDTVTFTDYQFRVDDSNYFYPASTVKLPISLLALEKLDQDPRFDRNSLFYVDGDTLETTFAKEITKIFAISDNEAYNRLFEYLGKDYINKALKDKGISPLRISHRLSTPDAHNPMSKAIIFHQNDSTLSQIQSKTSKAVERLNLKSVYKGKGYIDSNDSLVLEPFNFATKNYLPISSLHGIMKRIIFPDAFSKKEQFHLSPSDREFVLHAMSSVPRALGFEEQEYYDSYGKFLIYGDTHERIPESIKIYNKVGYAYGYLTDCAYIYDKESSTEFIVTANLLVNESGIFNTGDYQYDTVGIPFLAELGRELLETLKH
ncbi:serine hydrolase [Galbibacter sp.]|uniref:serine hydrolase n=1 Tax=Galbibacter sp. TaxID=2918471 RepID=UPI003A955B49